MFSRNNGKIKKDIFAVLFIISLTASLYAFNYNRGISLADEGRDVDAIVKILNGKMAYRDFRWVHGPLALYLHSLVFKFRGINLLYLRESLILIALLVMVFSYLLARVILPPLYSGIAALLSIGFYGFPQYTSNHIYGTLCGLISLMFVLNYVITGNKPHYLYACGISTGLIFGFMQAMGAFVYSAIALYLVLFCRDIKAFTKYSFFCALTVLFAYLYFIVNVPWNVLYENLNPLWKLKFLRGISTSTSFFAIFKNGFSTHSFNLWRNAVLFHLPLIAVLIVAMVLFYRFSKKIFNNTAQNKALLLFVIYQPIMLTKLYIDKEIEGVVFYAQIGMILAVYVLYLVLQGLKKWHSKASWLLRISLFCGLILLYLMEILPWTFSHYYGFKSDYKLPFKRAPVYVNYKLGETIKEAAEYIKDNTEDGDKVIFSPYYPMFNFLTERDNPLYDNAMTLGVFKDSKMEEDAIEMIRSNKVKYFIFARVTHTPERFERHGAFVFGKDYAVKLVDFIEKNYHFERKVGDTTFPPTSFEAVIYKVNKQ